MAVAGTAAAVSLGLGAGRISSYEDAIASSYWEYAESPDTVIYPHDGYKLRRSITLEQYTPDDSLLGTDADSLDYATDTVPRLTARDTIKAPDSLRLIDPFRYKYYVALLDSLTHVEVRDSLRKSESEFRKALDTLSARRDSTDRVMLDSIYVHDSTARAKAAFIAWYNSLGRKERKKYDAEQKELVKMHEADSVRRVKEDAKALKDSIIENTPRILETFALPDSMFYKRIITWTVDPDFQKMDVSVPDTSFNKYFHDFAFRRDDVNATWLGVAGSPVQTYDWFKRRNDSNVDFFTPNEAWSRSWKNLPMYNTKTPYTELAYWGTLLAKNEKESDNVHILTTQNITPGLNLGLQYDRWGGGGMLNREMTNNKFFSAWSNYTGKKYLLHAGYIHSRAIRHENGGIVTKDSEGRDGLYWIRDTTIDCREIPVNLSNAESETKNNTFFLEQQLRIPFNFINRIKAKKDSTYKYNPDSLDRSLTTAFIGHSSEFSIYARKYSDNLNGKYDAAYYKDSFYGLRTADSLRMSRLDNKIFLKLQPWGETSVVSKLNVGIGDRLNTYYAQDPEDNKAGRNVNENSVYLYAGVDGNIGKHVKWDAKGDYVFAGHDRNNFGVEANARVDFHPFRRAKYSPLSLSAHFETTLRAPNFYQNHMVSGHFRWDNDFSKISTTKIIGKIDIPYWKMDANVGYSVVAGHIYYGSDCIVRQKEAPLSILSASLRKDFAFWNVLHLDNRILFQMSSDQEALPLPMLALNLRWYAQFVAAKDRATRSVPVLTIQIGVDAHFNTSWYSPAWNPNIGVFYNQTTHKYYNGPFFDAFINMQWKRACIFIKCENAGQGWPMRKADYFSADGFIVTQRSLKLGILWPFYLSPIRNAKAGSHSPASHGAGSSIKEH